MPAKPTWLSNLDNILGTLRAAERTWVDRQTVQELLGVGRRRAQQILAPCVMDRVGANGLADRDEFILRLEQLAAGEDSAFEIRRRDRVRKLLAALRKERVEQPRLLVEAPTRLIQQQLDSLPPGVRLEPGRITVEFVEPQQALEKLLALALAAGQDWEAFEKSVRR